MNRKEIGMDEKKAEILKGIYEKLTVEQREKAKSCKSMDELMKLLGEWDIELPDDLLDIVAGGLSEVLDYVCWFYGGGAAKDPTMSFERFVVERPDRRRR